MIKRFAPLAVTALVALIPVGKPAPPSGSWQVDNGHSDARLSVDGTTNYGKTPFQFTVGFTRAIGSVRLDKDVPANSAVHFKLYPAGSMAPMINEAGQVSKKWLVGNLANHTLICFDSKSVTPVGDDKLTVTGILTLTRVDRNVEITPDDSYSGPVYGPPMIHRLTRPATFLFLIPPTGDGEILLKGTAHVSREDFPQLVTSVLSTYWPPVVEDKKCEVGSGGAEDYAGTSCTGKLVDDGKSTPESPSGVNSQEDYGTASDFNKVVAQHLDIHVHLNLRQSGAASAQAGGN